MDKLRSQLGAARCRGLPVQVGSGKGSAAIVHDFLRKEDEAAKAAVNVKELEKVHN